ncbi:hypothetical protein [Xaviernesmea oryzae]|uniref:hypothetical protein n=1 Tax=Xaviernesmea oryzae TaxID=464029 RepID=UPI0011144695|nr:hypothetical protein [Xaviernesmea oryzae]
MTAIEAIVNLPPDDNWRRDAAGVLPSICDNLQDAIPRLSQAVSRWLAPDFVAFSMATTAALLMGGEPFLRQDHLLQALLLRSELCAVTLRRSIAARGNLALYATQVRRAWAAEPANHPLQ